MPTVALDSTTSPSQLSITNMESIPLGTYRYVIRANHKDQNTDEVSYTLDIVVEDPCLTATMTIDPMNTVFAVNPNLTMLQFVLYGAR